MEFTEDFENGGTYSSLRGSFVDALIGITEVPQCEWVSNATA